MTRREKRHFSKRVGGCYVPKSQPEVGQIGYTQIVKPVVLIDMFDLMYDNMGIPKEREGTPQYESDTSKARLK